MSDEFRLAAGRIHDSRTYSDLFLDMTERGVRKAYREYLKQIHPDVAGVANAREAGELVMKLDALHKDALRALSGGTASKSSLCIIESAIAHHECMRQRTRFFDMTTGYDAVTTQGATSTQSIVKMAQRPRDNDLLEAEAAALAQLATTDDEHKAFYPTLLDSVVVERDRVRLRTNVLQACEGFVNLEQVHERYPNGIHPLDMAWMWRRILWALGGAHNAGVLHGAMVPRHILIHPAQHGVVLADWCYSVRKVGDIYPRLSAIVGQYRDWYPAAVLAREEPDVYCDTTMAAYAMRDITNESLLSRELRRYFDETIVSYDASAYDLLGRFDATLERLGAPYYPRTYRPFKW